jgi:MSHA biogenesis protein MshQ
MGISQLVLRWCVRLLVGLLTLMTTQAFSATLNFDNSASLPALKASGTCGTWNNEWSFSGSEFFCNAPVTFASGDIIRTTSSAVTIRANSGITLNNNSVGTSSNRVNLATSSGNMQISGSMVIYGNVLNGGNSGSIQGSSSASRITINGNVSSGGSLSLTNVTMTGLIQGGSSLVSLNTVNLTGSITSSGNLTLQAATVSGTINVSGSASVTNGSTVGGNITVGNGLASTGSVFNGNILSTNGNITLTGANVAGNISAPGNAITATNTDIAGTVTANGDIELTDVEVGGKVTSTSNEVFGTGTVFGNGISGHSGVEVTGGSIVGDLRSGCNNIILNSTTMTSGTIQTTPTLGSGCGADRVEFNNSTINASILGGPNNVYINDTQFTGDIKARFDVELDNSTVYGNISGEPGYALHLVDLTDSAIYGNVTVNTQFGDITGNWPNSGIYGSCSYEFVTPSLCSASPPPATDAYWKFDEAQWNGSSNQVLDSSVNLKHGSSRYSANTAVIDPSPASCTFGDFQRGSSSSDNPHVYIDPNAYFHNADDFGFTLWLKMNSSQQSGNRQVILAYGDEDGVNEEDEGRFELLRTSVGRLRFAVRMQSEELHYVEVNGSGIFDGQWKHIAVSYSKQNKRIRLYVNNVLVSDTLNASIGNGNKDRTPNDGNTGLSIGALPDGDHGIRGQIDEVKFFAHEPTAAEIQTMYQQTANCANECFNENFSSTANWYPTTLNNSTAPSLQSSPSRLRLTTNAQNQSTAITFKRSFPALGNKMTIEFDYYGFGGTGADGVALVLSDATVTPSPGSYGGSLGYAQRNNGNSGFAGGWLGIGFDEFGNYQLPAEGRVGGRTGNNTNWMDSVGIRASASKNYKWLAGTNTLSPGIDTGNNTLGPGHRYRITIDSTVTTPSQKVQFKLERRTSSSGTYSTLINTLDLMAQDQSAPPADLLLSYTGSTGDNTNFHDITNVQVCTQLPSTPIELGSQLHHIEFSYPASPLTCNPTEVTIKACANAACTELYPSPLTLNLAAVGGSWSGTNPFTFTGSTTKNLSKTTAGNFTVAVSSSSVTPQNPIQCKQNGLTDDCTFAVADSGFVFDVQNMVANQPQSVVISAVRKDNVSQQCVPGFKDVTRAVKLWSDYIDPIATGRPVSRPILVDITNSLSFPNVAIAQSSGAATNYNLPFNSNGQVTVKLNYIDAGQMQLNARYEGSASNGDNGLIMTGSDQFVSRPAGLCIREGNGVAAALSCSSPYETCSVYKKAGEDFNLAVIAKASANNGDANLCANTEVTPNFRLTDIPVSHSLLAPTVVQGGSIGTRSTPDYDHSQSTNAVSSFVQQVSEAGVFSFSTPALNYLGITIPAATSHAIGRFIPAYFSVATNTPVLAATCGAFNYLGKELTYSTNPLATFTARNMAGNVTNNYGGAFFRASALATTASALNTLYATTTSPAAVEAGFSRGSYSLTGQTNYDGQFGLTLTSDTVNFNRTVEPPYPDPFVPDLRLESPDSFILDSDAVCIRSSAAGACEDLVFIDITVPPLRYGRLVLKGGNVADPAAGATLVPLTFSTEFWLGTAFIVNTDDSCTVIDPVDVSFDASQTDNLTATGSGYTLTAGSTGSAAGLNVSIPLPVPEKRPLNGIWPVFYAAPAWLKYNWQRESATQVADNPSSEVSVGRFRGNKRQIFWQEKLN